MSDETIHAHTRPAARAARRFAALVDAGKAERSDNDGLFVLLRLGHYSAFDKLAAEREKEASDAH